MRERMKHSTGRWLRLGCLTLVLGCGDDSVDTAKIIEDIKGEGDGDMDVDDPTMTGDGDVAAGDGDVVEGDGDEPGDTPGPTPMTDAGTEVPGPGDGSDAGTEMPGPSAAYLRGEAIAVAQECADCHRENYAGAGFFPNISPDNTTGIGKWTDAQIAAAIKDGVGNDGKTLCSGMPKFELSDGEMSDLIVFLRGIPAVKKSITSVCPGHGK